MENYWDGDLEVCEDCYFAHHYGRHQHDGKWYAGESDIPADCEPLGRCEGLDLADNTDGETGEGITTFSHNSCDGCGSHLGGRRFRLAYKVLATA